MSLLKKGAKTLEREVLKTGLNIAQIRKVFDPLEPMSILSAPNTHKPHWSV
jgi:hypothetical protein